MSSNQQNNNSSPNSNNQNTSIKQKISWSLIISLASLIVAGFTVPSLKCFLGFCISENKSKQFEIITQTESGESLQGARIQVIAKNNPPETKNTDVNGYAKVNIPSERDVIVNIAKKGYEIQTIAINTENEQSTTRTIQLVKKK